jgi:DNA-binding Lrp family transcriptional regulator
MDALPALDDTDRRLLEIVLADPRVGVREFSRRLGVARGTAQARLDKLEARGVLASWAPQVDPSALGYPLGALVHI